MRPRGADRERRDRSGIAVLLGYGEFLIDTVVALALIVGGTILLGVVVYDFVHDLGQGLAMVTHGPGRQGPSET